MFLNEILGARAAHEKVRLKKRGENQGPYIGVREGKGSGNSSMGRGQCTEGG